MKNFNNQEKSYGRGRGFGRGAGQGAGQQGAGQGAGQVSQGSGPGGFCVCPSCGEKTEHQVGIPCYEVKCPKCGTMMVREN